MTNGLVQAGIQVVAGVDLDLAAKETYEYNNPGAKFINKDITKLQLDFLKNFLDFIQMMIIWYLLDVALVSFIV